MKKGRDLELLVARVEKLLAGKDAVVTSPESIHDRDSGQLRECDCTVRYKSGTVPVLVVFECRKRKHRNGSQWIEELIGKRHSVGASVMVAVSSAPLSAPANLKAAKHGILVRTMSDLLATDLESVIRVNGIVIDKIGAEYNSLWVNVAGLEYTFLENIEEIRHWVRSQSPEAFVFIDVDSGDEYNVTDIWSQVRASDLEKLRPTNTTGTLNVRLPVVPQRPVHMRTPFGDVRILSLVFGVKTWIESENLAPTGHHAYTSESGEYFEVVETVVSFADGSELLTCLFNDNAGSAVATMTGSIPMHFELIKGSSGATSMSQV